MKTPISKPKPTADNGKVSKKSTTLPKIKLGGGRQLAEIDYDAVFDNQPRK